MNSKQNLNNNSWQPNSWKEYPVSQAVDYADSNALNTALNTLENLPELISLVSINRLKNLFKLAEENNAFILQGGDCSEAFSDCNARIISKKVEMITHMQNLLSLRLKKPVINIGRIAGQYAKPRTHLNETQNDITLPSYRGDIINRHKFSKISRTPNPKRLLKAYDKAKKTLQFWQSSSSPLFTSHEALHLPFETALTRKDETQTNHYYNASTHFPWIGMRTLHLPSAHVEYMRGIINPIGLKIGPDINLIELMEILAILNPKHESGKIVLIHRFGKTHIQEHLPLLLKALKESKHPCAIICDPMHGNTQITESGVKTRLLDDILSELTLAFEIHESHQRPLSGIHLEMTYEPVTECLGGSVKDLSKNYKSLVDPRLNYEQALSIAQFTSLL